MTVSWNKEKYKGLPAPTDDLLREIIRQNSERFKDPQKMFVLRPHRFMLHLEMLFSMLEFSQPISSDDAKEIIKRALQNIKGNEKISARNLLQEINKAERDFLDKPIKRYILATSLSISSNENMNRIRTDGDYIIFEKEFPRKIEIARRPLLDQYRRSSRNEKEIPVNYLRVRVHVSGRSQFDAVDQALRKLNFIRGMWNWFIIGKTIRVSNGEFQPVNKILLGPVHTLHYISGEPVSPNVFWYEPLYQYPNIPYEFQDTELKILYKNHSIVFKRLQTHTYPKRIQELFIKFAEALDHYDWGTSFYKLWSLLETLTDTGAKYDDTIKRTLFLWKNVDYHRNSLELCRRIRNQIVHSSPKSTHQEALLYNLLMYINRLFEFHLFDMYNSGSLENAVSLLDKPHNVEVISKQIADLQAAKKFLS